MKTILLPALLVATLILSSCVSRELEIQTVIQTQTITPQAETVTVTLPPITMTETLSSTITATTTLPAGTQTVTLPAETITKTVTETSPTVTVTTTSPPITITVTTIPPSPAQAYRVTKELSYIITQKTSHYWYFSWQVTIENLTSQDLTLYIEVHFLDVNGFSLERDNDIVSFNPVEEKTILGERMIDIEIADDIVGAIITIEII